MLCGCCFFGISIHVYPLRSPPVICRRKEYWNGGNAWAVISDSYDMLDSFAAIVFGGMQYMQINRVGRKFAYSIWNLVNYVRNYDPLSCSSLARSYC